MANMQGVGTLGNWADTTGMLSVGTFGWWEAPPSPVVVTGAAPGISIGDDTISLSTVIPNPGLSISDVNPTVIVEQ